jgi:DNA-binding transcriptional LysR family regulator
MDLRHMRHFLAVAEELHFGRAARRLNIAQPPLSQSIKRLETDLGVDLFKRSRRGVELTPAGQVFMREARRALVQADLAVKLARREASRISEVRVNFIGPALYRLLPPLLVGFTERAPQTHVRLSERPSPAQVEAIMAGDADIGFVTAAAAATEIENCETFLMERAPLVAVVPSSWPLARRRSVTLADLSDRPFILPPPTKYGTKPTETLSLFTKAGMMPLVTQESTHANTTLSLVGAGLGFSLITATAALTKAQNVSFVPIAEFGTEPQWGLMMIWRPDHLTSAAKSFVSFAVDYVRATPGLLEFPLER